jgi:hypothetical protein
VCDWFDVIDEASSTNSSLPVGSKIGAPAQLSPMWLQLRAVTLHPTPDRGVTDVETTLLQQFLNIAQRKRKAKIPPDSTKYESAFGLSPFEDRGSGYHFAILSRHQLATITCNTSFALPQPLEKLFQDAHH